MEIKHIQMKALLRTNDYSEGVRVVDVIKNPISKTNGLAHVIIDGEERMTGGMLFEINEITMKVLKDLTPKEQWDWLRSIKNDMTVL